MYQRLMENQPEMIPQVVLIDGNGVLHPRGFGLASHFGVLANTCTIGVAKNLHHLGDSIIRDDIHQAKINDLKEPGGFFLLENKDHETVGAVKCPLNFKQIFLKFQCCLTGVKDNWRSKTANLCFRRTGHKFGYGIVVRNAMRW